MKTKTIFNLLAFAMLMPAMLLTTACSSSEDLADNKPETTEPTEPTEPIAKKGYELPVTINVTRQGDDATRASYTDNGDGTGSLSFSTGDQLFVKGEDTSENGAGKFAGTIEWQSGGKFSGTITTEKEYTGTADDLFTATANVSATLLPAGYEDYGYLSINANNEYDAVLIENAQKSIANSKALAVEQLSFELAVSYTSGKGFELAPLNAILNFTISGLTANKTVTATLSGDAEYTISGEVTTDETGKATFAMGVFGTRDLNELSLTVDGDPVTLVGSSKELEAGHIYNINRRIVDLSQTSGDITLKNGDIATGTMTGHQLLIEDEATVTLCGASVTAPDDWGHGAIRCLGDATIILADGTVNTAQSGKENNYAAVSVPAGKTLTIRGGSAGTGKLVANAFVSGEATGSYRAGIGGWSDWPEGERFERGGNLIIEGGDITASGHVGGAGIGAAAEAPFSKITISGGTVTATGGSNGAGIGCGPDGSGPSECGDITIEGGTVTATGGERGAGIGSGGAFGSCRYITIIGGTVTAKGGKYAAGIGSGESSCGYITIEGGTVTATGGERGAGIGSGVSSCDGEITIKGGTVTATGGSNGAGIGSGAQGSCDGINISGGTVEATGGIYAAGIGSGAQGSCNGIYIGSNVTSVIATKGQYAKNSIGAGNNGTCDWVEIEDGANVQEKEYEEE